MGHQEIRTMIEKSVYDGVSGPTNISMKVSGKKKKLPPRQEI